MCWWDMITIGSSAGAGEREERDCNLKGSGGTRIARVMKVMKTAPNQKGFTLTEMLVTVAVMAIAAATAVPSAVQLLAQYQLSSAANQVGFEISRAKMQAVAQNRSVRLVVTGGDTVCRQSLDPKTGLWEPQSCDSATGSVKLPRTTSASGTGPIFYRSGLATSAGVIEVRNGAGVKAVGYNILGRVTIS
jgi:prepilin-type N-terminal cleavage/methylation domain-containing protein